MADYDRYEEGSGAGFIMGLLTGAVLGVGLGMLLAPKAGAELRGTLGARARDMSQKASEQYRHAAEMAGQWAEKGREVVGKAREAMQRSAEEGHGYAGATTGSSYGGGSYATGSQASFGGNSGTNQ